MQFGLTFFPTIGPADKSAEQYFRECLQLVDLAEELGFNHVKTVEHYFFSYGGYSPDPVTFLAAAAGRTKRIRLGTSAVVPAFTHPIKLAGKLAMLDAISAGRLDVAFGRAFLPDEFTAFGVSMDDSRLLFTEGVEACKRLWSEEGLEWHGRFHQFGPVTLLPRPVQQPHPPVFVATARSAESYTAAGYAGHHLQTVPGVMPKDVLQERLDNYRHAWIAVGHQPGDEQIHLSYPCVVAEDMALARRNGRIDDERNSAAIAEAVQSWAHTSSSDYPGYEKMAEAVKRPGLEDKIRENKVLVGTPEEVTMQVRTIGEWFGNDVTLSLGVHSGQLSIEDSKQTVRLLAEHVIPQLEANFSRS